MEPIFLGLDLPALVSIPMMIGAFAFAVWYGITQFSIGIDAEEQARRKAASSRREKAPTIAAKKKA